MALTDQRTLRSSIDLTGIGLHSGLHVNMRIKPAAANHGIAFVRSDQKFQSQPARLLVNPYQVQDTPLCSCLVQENTKVATVEHLMSALMAMAIDNAEIEVDRAELPIMDTAAPFTPG